MEPNLQTPEGLWVKVMMMFGAPPLLALAIPAARRPTEDHRRDSRSDPTLSAREPGLGSPEDPRRAVEARVRRL